MDLIQKLKNKEMVWHFYHKEIPIKTFEILLKANLICIVNQVSTTKWAQ